MKSIFRVVCTKIVEYCAQHALNGVVNLYNIKCRTEGCGKRPSFGVAGTNSAEYCAQHSTDRTVNVCRKMSTSESCKKSFRMANTKEAKHFAQHALN